jgi:hypothetical protein
MSNYISEKRTLCFVCVCVCSPSSGTIKWHKTVFVTNYYYYRLIIVRVPLFTGRTFLPPRNNNNNRRGQVVRGAGCHLLLSIILVLRCWWIVLGYHGTYDGGAIISLFLLNVIHG